MNNIEDMVVVVHRLKEAVKSAPTQKEHDQLQKSLALANSRLMKARAKRINEAPRGNNIPSEYKNIRRSMLSDEEKIELVKKHGQKVFLSMPK